MSNTKVMITKNKIDTLANGIIAVGGGDSTQTLDELSATMSSVIEEIDTQEDLIAQLLEDVNNLPESSGGSANDMLQTRVDSNNSCEHLFYSYTGNNVDFISNLDTSNVTNMSRMFEGCSNLTTIPQLDTSNVTNMSNMFYNCLDLTTIPQLDTSNVTNMSNMFYGCYALTSIPLLDTSKVTDMYDMFSKCRTLTSIPLLDTSKVTDMGYMFDGCYSLTSIPLLDTSKVTDMGGMFSSCHKLAKIDISYYDIFSTSEVAYWCSNCYSLKALIIRSFGSNYVLNFNSFQNCYHLTGAIHSTYNPEGLRDGYIYVPRSMCDTLKSATNWSTYASQIRSLEDFTIDGTVDGELDEEKVNQAEPETPSGGFNISALPTRIYMRNQYFYSLDNGIVWQDFYNIGDGVLTNPILTNVTQIKFKIKANEPGTVYIRSESLGLNLEAFMLGTAISENYVLTSDIIDLDMGSGI